MENIHIEDVDITFRNTFENNESDGVYKNDVFADLNIDENNFPTNVVKFVESCNEEWIGNGHYLSNGSNTNDSILSRDQTNDLPSFETQNHLTNNNSKEQKNLTGYKEKNNKRNNQFDNLRRSARRRNGNFKSNKPNYNINDNNNNDDGDDRERKRKRRMTNRTRYTKHRVDSLQKQVSMLQQEIVRLRKHLSRVSPSTQSHEGGQFTSSNSDVTDRGGIETSPFVIRGRKSNDVSRRGFRLSRKYSCPGCPRSFANYNQLCRHVGIHSGKRPYVCKACDKSFVMARQLRVHDEVVHSGERPHLCEDDLISHVTVHEDVKCFESSDGEFNSHKRSSDERPYMCDICGLRFVRRSHMVRHSKVHTGEKPFYCDECGRSFARLNHLQRHGRTLHQDAKSFRCYLCSSVHENKEQLRHHMTSHDIQQALPCPYCGLEFKSQSKLSKHAKLCHQQCPGDVIRGGGANIESTNRAIVPKSKKHVCDQCHKTYKSSSALIIHKRTHSGERPYICDVCATGFSRSSSLIRHRRSHTGEKPHVCQTCKKAYARKHLLSSHICSAHNSTSQSPPPTSTLMPSSISIINESADTLDQGVLLCIGRDQSSPFAVY